MEDVRKGKRNGRSHIGMCVSVCNCCFCVLVSKHVQSPSELLSAEQWQEGLGRPNTTCSRLQQTNEVLFERFLKERLDKAKYEEMREGGVREDRRIKVTRKERR